MTALVAGGGGGLGTAVARRLVERGLPVAILDRSEADAAAAADAVRTGPAQVLSVTADITRGDEVDAAWERASGLGPVDTIVNCVGIWNAVPFVEMSREHWDRIMAVNLAGAFELARCAAGAWIPAGVAGSIVHIASVAGVRSHGRGSSAYGASKAGLLGLTTHLAVELGRHGIRVNAIAPGSMRTPMSAARLARPGEEERSNAMVPLGRIADPDDIASVAAFVAVDATYVNGVVLPVDGGRLAQM